MRTIITALLLAISTLLSAQAPQGINYQAVIRDNNGNVIVNQLVGILVNVRTGGGGGPIAYAETHAVTTGVNGQLNLIIGQGTPQTGTFAALDWGANTHYAEIQVDVAGGNNYQSLVAMQLLSVPYAFYADVAGAGPPGPAGPAGPMGPSVFEESMKDSLVVMYSGQMAYGYSQDTAGVGHWSSNTLSQNSYQGIGSKKGVALYSNSMAYAYYRDNAGFGSWASRSLSQNAYTAAATTKIIVLYSNSAAYAFYVDAAGVGTWTSQTLSQNAYSHVSHGDKIILYNNFRAYSFSIDDNGNGVWQNQTFNQNTYNVITTK